MTESKITVTYPGYDQDKFKVQNSELRIEETKKKYGIKRDYILFLSTLKPSKNIEGLVSAYDLLNSDLQLVIAGKKGWLYETIFEKVKELKLGRKS